MRFYEGFRPKTQSDKYVDTFRLFDRIFFVVIVESGFNLNAV